MRLVVLRHGHAGDREAWTAEGRDDRSRPLTSEGKKTTRRVVSALESLVPELTALAASPLVRARQSAEIVAKSYDVEIETLDALTPERDPADTLQWLRAQPSDATVMIVGHEPHLSTLAGYLLTNQRVSFINLKKSGVCLLDLADPPAPGDATLEWLLSPGVLRKLG